MNAIPTSATPLLPPAELVRVASLAREAGDLLLTYFAAERASLGIELKSDESPVSRADRESDAHIAVGLARIFPGEPVISEEAALPAWDTRRHWPTFLLVDPLDGTKEFLRGRPDFTVNIARIENGAPAWGVIHVPVEDLLVVGKKGVGAWVSRGGADFVPVVPPQPDANSLRAVLSQSHRDASEQPLIERFGLASLVRRGSSLKFLLVALGEVDVYFRKTPTWEWDTAAGQAIVESVGGVVCDTVTGEPLRCNRENPLNGPFLACMETVAASCLERQRRD